MDRIASAPALPPFWSWLAGALRPWLRRLVQSLAVAADALRPRLRDEAPNSARAALATGAPEQTQRLTLLFTDIKGSSALYRRFGDAAAARVIRAHLMWLHGLVQRFGGVPIKSMGDGTLAAFSGDAAAVAAALAAQAELGALDRSLGEPGLVLRIAVHAGPCIVAQSGTTPDCFGTTVNVAARLLRLSQGHDIAISAATVGDPAVASLLTGYRRVPAELAMSDAQAIQAVRVAPPDRTALTRRPAR